MTKQAGVSFSEHFGVDETWLEEKGIFNPTLDLDTPLFIDPFLLPKSKHEEFSSCAFDAYEQHFAEIHKILSASKNQDDKLWKAALKKFQFSEAKGMSGTCLGYSKKSTRGRAFGPVLSRRALSWAKEVIDLGVKDPELFSSMSIFEENIGSDRISDMVASITLECILTFNARVLSEIKAELGVTIPTRETQLRALTANLPINPFSNEGAPVILLPRDVLRHLPMMDDHESLATVAEKNADLRDRVNSHISEIFKIRTKKEKEEIRNRAMESAAAFQTLLDLLKKLEDTAYDFQKDPEGLLEWRTHGHNFPALYKLKINDDPTLDRLTRIDRVCVAIIDQFQSLIEDHRLSRTLYVDDEPRHERYAQLLFFAIAVSYCNANDLDISPEADAGAGPVDFKFSNGTDKVVVEIKLSTSSYVVKGYEKQLSAYMKAEHTDVGYYVVIDVGKLGDKWKRLGNITKKNPAFSKRKKTRLIDGSQTPSASHL